MLPPAPFISTGLFLLPLNPSSPPLSPDFHVESTVPESALQPLIRLVLIFLPSSTSVEWMNFPACLSAARPVNRHLLWNKNQWALKCDFVACDLRRFAAHGPLAQSTCGRSGQCYRGFQLCWSLDSDICWWGLNHTSCALHS